MCVTCSHSYGMPNKLSKQLKRHGAYLSTNVKTKIIIQLCLLSGEGSMIHMLQDEILEICLEKKKDSVTYYNFFA